MQGAGKGMRRAESGFVLITSLLVMVVLAGLGAGAYFLTSMNLRIAENTRSSTIAHYNAHSGLDVALLAMAREFQERGDGSWPSLSELQARIPAGSPYRVTALDMDLPDAQNIVRGGSLTVVGEGPRDARYETGARFVGELTPVEVEGDADPIFGTGWVTDAAIRFNGASSFYIPLWAGQSVVGNATKVLGSSGLFAHSGFVGGSPATCSIHNKSTVTCNRGQTPPVVPAFVFEERYAAMAAQSVPCTAATTFDSSVSRSANLHTNSTICLGENVTLTLTGTASGLTILGPRSSTVDLRASSQPFGGDPDGVGLRMTVGRVILSNSGTSVLRGTNTVFTAESINLGIASDAIGGSGGVVSTLFGTERNVTFGTAGGGGGGSGGTFHGMIWAHGHVCKTGDGGLSFIGTLLVGGNGSPPGSPCTEGIYWNGGGGGTFAGVSNIDIPEVGGGSNNPYAAAGIRVVARRP